MGYAKKYLPHVCVWQIEAMHGSPHWLEVMCSFVVTILYISPRDLLSKENLLMHSIFWLYSILEIPFGKIGVCMWQVDSMWVCMHICICISIHACIFLYVGTYAHVRKWQIDLMCVCMHICIHIYLHKFVCTYQFWHTRKHACTHIHTHTQTCLYIHTQLCLYTYTQICLHVPILAHKLVHGASLQRPAFIHLVNMVIFTRMYFTRCKNTRH